jgi:predicted RNase H-like nuclease (RuvC/YqgF family)
MRKFLVSAVMATAALSAAAPASAQSWRLQASTQRQIQQDINQLDRQISRATQRRTVSQREATGLRRQAMNLQRTYNRYSRNGLDRQEVTQLERQVNQLHAKLRLERRDWDGRRG